jgi:hypothetical protein
MVYEHVTDRKREAVRREAAEKGYELIESEPRAGQYAEVSMSGRLRLIDEPEGLRLATKIAYTGFAYRLAPDNAIRNTSDAARVYVRTGDGAPAAKLFLTEGYFKNCAQGPHQHSVVIVGRQDRRSIKAIVRLFSGLSYLVTLSEQYDGADFYNSLVYDAQCGGINEVPVAHLRSELLQIEHMEASAATVWNDRVVSGNWFVKFIECEITSKLRGRKNEADARGARGWRRPRFLKPARRRRKGNHESQSQRRCGERSIGIVRQQQIV